MHQRDVVVMPEQVDHGLGFVEPQQAVIDEHASELVADRLVDQHRGDGGIDAAGQAADHLALADLGADFLDRFLAERAHGPVAGEAGDLADEIADQFGAVGRMHHFGMEHQPVISALLVLDHRERRIRRDAGDFKARRHLGDAVAMAHPHRMPLAHVPGGIEQPARGLDLDIGAAEFAVMAALDGAAELGGHGHLAVADAEHRHAGIEDRLRRARRACLMHRFRAAGEDHRFRLHLQRTRLPPSGTARSRNRRPPRAPAARSVASPGCRNRRSESCHAPRPPKASTRGLAVLGCHGKELRDPRRRRNPSTIVMAGLVPAIHVFHRAKRRQDVDARA